MPPHTSFHLGYFSLLRPCETACPPVQEVCLSHFRMRLQMENCTANRAGHLDPNGCLGLLLCQGREALHSSPSTSPRVKGSHSRPVDPFLPYLGTGLFTPPPHLAMSLSASAEEEGAGPHMQAAVCLQVFFFLLPQASAPAPSESSWPSRLLSSEKVDC